MIVSRQRHFAVSTLEEATLAASPFSIPFVLTRSCGVVTWQSLLLLLGVVVARFVAVFLGLLPWFSFFLYSEFLSTRSAEGAPVGRGNVQATRPRFSFLAAAPHSVVGDDED